MTQMYFLMQFKKEIGLCYQAWLVISNAVSAREGSGTLSQN